MLVAEVTFTLKNRLLHLSSFPPICLCNFLPIDFASVQIFVVGCRVTAFKLVEIFLFELDFVKRLKRLGLLCQPFRLLKFSLLGFQISWDNYGLVLLRFIFLNRLIDFLTLFGSY